MGQRGNKAEARSIRFPIWMADAIQEIADKKGFTFTYVVIDLLRQELVAMDYNMGIGKEAASGAGKPLLISDPNPPTRPWAADLIRGNPKDYYCVLVCGTSMTESDIKDSDYALLRRSDGAENGEIMLVKFDDSSTLKRVKVVEDFKGREEVYIWWEDGSGQKAKLEGEGVEIQGKLIAIERKPV